MSRTSVQRQHAPMTMYQVEVTAVADLNAHLRRITFGAAELAEFIDDGPDQRCRLFLPRAGQNRPLVSAGPDWYQIWRTMPADVRPIMRTYTIRRHRREHAEIDIDFVLHGDAGPASAWAGQARIGDRAAIYGAYADYDPLGDIEWQLLAGDDTALPAIAAILERLPETMPAQVFIEVDGPDEEIPLPAGKSVRVRYVHRDGVPARTSGLWATPSVDRIPRRDRTCLGAGESVAVREIRRHLVNDRGMPADTVTFTGYWRLHGSIGQV
jgi:NADPH-dependent ferric siderophore reductase